MANMHAFEKNYEKTILEYDRLAKNYPEGDKVLHILLQKGLSFLNLGDKPTARLLLQQVVKDYPNTNQTPQDHQLEGNVSITTGILL